jgi:hypothetical protein
MACEKLQKLLELIKQLVVSKKTGCLEVNFSEGGIGRVEFKERVL